MQSLTVVGPFREERPESLGQHFRTVPGAKCPDEADNRLPFQAVPPSYFRSVHVRCVTPGIHTVRIHKYFRRLDTSRHEFVAQWFADDQYQIGGPEIQEFDAIH